MVDRRFEREFAEAQDITTHPTRLAVLAQSGYRSVRVAVAGNPNSSPETLRALSQATDHLHRPDARILAAIEQNPVLPLLALEDPSRCEIEEIPF